MGGIVEDILDPITGVKSQKKAAEATAQSQRTQQRIANIKAARERRAQVAEARLKRAQIAAAAGGRGITGSSSAIGAESSVQTQLASNISFLDQTAALAEQASIFNETAAREQGKAASKAAIGSTIFSAINALDLK